MIYEFLVGNTPFGSDQDEPYNIYKEVLKANLYFPRIVENIQSKLIIQQLLNKNPASRIGGSISNLKDHK